MVYEARLVAPAASNKNYLHTSKGGYNYCIHIKNGSVLPNCVGYAWGRWRELLGKYHNLARTNAENWYLNTYDGYKRGQTPKVGAVICWQKGKAYNSKDGAGHVAIVEQINKDGSIIISQSAYGGARFTTKTLKAPYKLGSSYTFQGFIYLPIEFEEKSITDIAQEVISGAYGAGPQRKKALEALGYDYNEVQTEVNRLLGVSITTVSAFAIGEKVELTSNATYYNGAKIPLWVKNSTLYVREIDGNRIVISLLKKGAVTGAVNRKYLVKK